jgi:chemotaxis methyl-accepting protein methylase
MDFDQFIKEVAPLLHLQWRRFKRGGIKRKVERRITEIGLSHFEDYLLRIERDPEEKNRLSQILTVTITRFFRDREVFDILEHFIIPSMIRYKGPSQFKTWSIGCANGEEPYSLSMLWGQKFEKIWSQVELSILATDINENVLKRAKEGKYKKSGLKEVPEEFLRRFFKVENGFYILDRSIQERVEFRKHHVIQEESFSGMDLVFCRNLAFTYFTQETQARVLKKIFSSLKDDGYLIIGKDESPPLVYPTLFVPVYPKEKIYQKFNAKK